MDFEALKSDLEEADYSIYQLFFDLVHEVTKAHATKNEVELAKIYSFSQWCLAQEEKDLWNAAAVAFYESLFDGARAWESVAAWISPFVLTMCLPLWEGRLGANASQKIAKLVRRES